MSSALKRFSAMAKNKSPKKTSLVSCRKLKEEKLQIGDVLLGRGSGVSRHPGNIRFRMLVKLYKEEYNTTARQEKMNVAEKVVFELQSMKPPGRFITEVRDERYVRVQHRVAVEKTSQALRERKWSPFSRTEAYATLKELNTKLAEVKDLRDWFQFNEAKYTPSKESPPPPPSSRPPPQLPLQKRKTKTIQTKGKQAVKGNVVKKGTTTKKQLPTSKPVVKVSRPAECPSTLEVVTPQTGWPRPTMPGGWPASAVRWPNPTLGLPTLARTPGWIRAEYFQNSPYPNQMMMIQQQLLQSQRRQQQQHQHHHQQEQQQWHQDQKSKNQVTPKPPPPSLPKAPKLAATTTPPTTTVAPNTASTSSKRGTLPKPPKAVTTKVTEPPAPCGKFKRLERMVNDALQEEFDLYLAHLPPTIYEAYYLAHFAATASETSSPPQPTTFTKQASPVTVKQLDEVDLVQEDDERCCLTV